MKEMTNTNSKFSVQDVLSPFTEFRKADLRVMYGMHITYTRIFRCHKRL